MNNSNYNKNSLVKGLVTNRQGYTEAELNRGVFLFSLDFELAWGTRGRANAIHMPPFLDGTRAAVIELIDLFERYQVSGTWAVVGAMMLEKSTEDEEKHRWISGIEFNDVPPGDSKTHPHWYSGDLIKALLKCRVKQDIGCHTLTHQFVDATDSGRKSFRTELERFQQLFSDNQWEPATSFIFPKAKMAHYDLLAEMGFRSFRGPESRWFESLPGVKIPAAFRLLDAKITCTPQTNRPILHPAGLWEIPSSQFYSPFYNVGKHVSVSARVKKAIKGLKRAVDTRGVFHLWTHPFNLGVCTKELLQGLDEILFYAKNLHDKGNLELCSMHQLSSQCDEMISASAHPQTV